MSDLSCAVDELNSLGSNLHTLSHDEDVTRYLKEHRPWSLHPTH